MRKALIALGAVLACASARAAAPVWEFAGWYGGGCFPGVAFDAKTPGRVYLASDVAGIWRSDDGGDTWNFKTDGLENLNVASIAVSASGAVLAATQNGLFRSDDAGERWSVCGGPAASFSFQRPESYRPVSVGPDGQAVFAGLKDGRLWASADGCRSWKEFSGFRFAEGPVTAVQELDGAVWAAAPAGLARCRPETGVCEKIEGSPAHVTDFRLRREEAGRVSGWAASQGRLLRYDEPRWTAVGAAPAGAYRVEPGTGRTLGAAFNDGWKGRVAFSPDAGQSWQDADEPMAPDAAGDPTRAWAAVRSRVAALAASPHDPNLFFRTDWWGVWRSRDGGRSWQETIRGAANTVATDVAVDSGGRLWAATMDNGLLVSADQGRTFSPVFPASGYDPQVQGHVWRVRALPSGRVIGTSSPWSANFNQVIASEDGSSFTRTHRGLPERRPSENAVWEFGYPRALAASADASRLYLGIDGTGGGLFLSDDGGAGWSPAKAQVPHPKVYRGLAVDPADPKRIYWANHDKETGAIYFSEDGGGSWKKSAHSPRTALDLAVSPDGRVYAGDDEGFLYESADRGASFKRIADFSSKGSAAALAWLPGSAPRLAAGFMRWHGAAGGGLVIGDPQTGKWEDYSAGLPGGNGVSAVAFDPAGKILYAARFGNSIFKTRLEE